MPDVVTLRPFVPARDFPRSTAFYADLGFSVRPMGPGLAEISHGASSFLLQEYKLPDLDGHFMMHLLTKDLDAWWQHIESLDLATKYGVRPPSAPAMQPWGLIVSYVVDPGGVLWHFAQQRA